MCFRDLVEKKSSSVYFIAIARDQRRGRKDKKSAEKFIHSLSGWHGQTCGAFPYFATNIVKRKSTFDCAQLLLLNLIDPCSRNI